MTNAFTPENDPFSYEPGTEPTYDAAQEVVGVFVSDQVDSLQTKYGILAQHFFSEVANGNLGTDLTVYEFLEYQAKPLERELNSWLDW